MLNFGPLALLTSGLLLCFLVAPLAAQSCTSCGPECVSACGSRRYRTCCFNYLRKRRSPAAPGAPAAELADIAGAPLQLQGLQVLGDGLALPPDDMRLQLVLVPSDHLEEAQDAAAAAAAGPLLGAQSLLRRLLDGQQPVDNEVGGGGGGSSGGGGGGPGGSSGGSSAETTSAPAPATLQRHRVGGVAGAGAGVGAGPGAKDWLADLRRRVGLMYNV